MSNLQFFLSNQLRTYSPLVKQLISRNFWNKVVEVFFTLCAAQFGKMRYALSSNFFREVSYLVTSLVKSLLSRNLCQT